MRIEFCSKTQLFAICVFLIASAVSVHQSGITNQAPLDVSRTVGKILPHVDRQLLDTLKVKDPQGTYEPGDSSIVHAHLDLLFIY